MLDYSKEVVNNLGVSRSQYKGWCQWILVLLRDILLRNQMGMIGSSYSMVSNDIGLKSSIMDVRNLVIFSMNTQGNRQADSMLMV